MKTTYSFSVIGFGRFGRLWAEILSRKGTVSVYDHSFSTPSVKPYHFVSLNQALNGEIIFLCIPISEVESFLKHHAEEIPETSIVADTASVKSLPLKWMDRFLANVPHIGTHPLFGPDSYYQNRINPVIITASDRYSSLTDMFSKLFTELNLEPVLMNAEEHDHQISLSQGITHLMGNVFNEMNLPEALTPTRGFTLLQAVGQFCANDTAQLFHDMLGCNPYTRELLKRFNQATQATYQRIYTSTDKEMRIGIMGVEGSFSHQAAMSWAENNPGRSLEFIYLITADGVLSALESGEITHGLLAIQNAAGGVVVETIEALAKYSHIHIMEYYPFLVEQCLLKRKDQHGEPVAIYSHTQALKQSERYLRTHYSGIPQISAEDTALSAKNLSSGILNPKSYVVAPAVCADLYHLNIVARGIQNLEHNLTDFIVVKG